MYLLSLRLCPAAGFSNFLSSHAKPPLQRVDAFLKDPSALLKVLEHSPACACRREQHIIACIRVRSAYLNGLLHVFRVHDIRDTMFLCALSDLISCLANEDEIADFSVKVLDPLVILGMLVISACD